MSSTGYVAVGAAIVAAIALARTTSRGSPAAQVDEDFDAAPTAAPTIVASGLPTAVGDVAQPQLASDHPRGGLFVAQFRRVVEEPLAHPQAATFQSLTRRELVARYGGLDPTIRAARWTVEGTTVALPWDVRPEDSAPFTGGPPESNVEWWARGAPSTPVTNNTTYPWGQARRTASGEVAADLIQGDLYDYFGLPYIRDGAKAIGGAIRRLL